MSFSIRPEMPRMQCRWRRRHRLYCHRAVCAPLLWISGTLCRNCGCVCCAAWFEIRRSMKSTARACLFVGCRARNYDLFDPHVEERAARTRRYHAGIRGCVRRSKSTYVAGVKHASKTRLHDYPSTRARWPFHVPARQSACPKTGPPTGLFETFVEDIKRRPRFARDRSGRIARRNGCPAASLQ